MALAVLLPCLVAVGRALGAGPAYYLLVPVVLVLLLLPPIAAGCGLTALLVRVFPSSGCSRSSPWSPCSRSRAW